MRSTRGYCRHVLDNYPLILVSKGKPSLDVYDGLCVACALGYVGFETKRTVCSQVYYRCQMLKEAEITKSGSQTNEDSKVVESWYRWSNQRR